MSQGYIKPVTNTLFINGQNPLTIKIKKSTLSNSGKATTLPDLKISPIHADVGKFFHLSKMRTDQTIWDLKKALVEAGHKVPAEQQEIVLWGIKLNNEMNLSCFKEGDFDRIYVQRKNAL